MKTYTILKTFHGSQDGLHTEAFIEGTTAVLSDDLARIVVAEGWAEPAAEAPSDDRETKVEAPAETKPAKPAREKITVSLRSALTLTSAPAAEPVSLAEVKAQARIDSSDEDALLEGYLTAARQMVEEHLRRSLITQTWKLTLDPLSCGWADNLPAGTYDLPVSALSGGLPRRIDLPKGPVQSVTSVTTYNSSGTSAVFSSSNYYLDSAGARLVLYDTASWPSDLRPAAACEIVYVAGYGSDGSAVPQPVRTAITQSAQRMYDERLTCDMPPTCERLLRPYRVLGEAPWVGPAPSTRPRRCGTGSPSSPSPA